MKLFLKDICFFTSTKYNFLNSFPILNHPKTPVKSALNQLFIGVFGGWLTSIVDHFFENIELNNTKAHKIISDLRDSWEVYRLREVKDNYTSLHKRLNIMQNNFKNYYNKALKIDSLPKAIVKIGGVHASKGRTVDNIFDMGNLLMELANYNGGKSTTALIIPSAHLNDDGTIENNVDKEDEVFIRPLINEAKGKWILIDLKKIEKFSWKHKIEFKSLKDYMYRFDYLIITPPSKFTELNYKN
jgi:hypothetical protein